MMIIANLWPYALHYVNDAANATPKKSENVTQLGTFLSVALHYVNDAANAR